MKITSYLLVLLNLFFLTSMSAQRDIKSIAANKKYPVQKGSLLFNKDNVKMNYVKNTEVRKDTILVKNPSGLTIIMKLKPLPAYMTCKIKPDTLKPDMEGKIYVTFDAAMKNDYGYCYESLNIITNDSAVPEKYFFMMAYIEEDFSGLSKVDRENAPRIDFEKESYNFGKIKSGEKLNYSYKFTNKGKSDLIIRRTKASCGCTATEPAKSVLKPGESSQINIVFDSNGLKGEQHKNVFVYCNDPRYSTVTLQFTGTVTGPE